MKTAIMNHSYLKSIVRSGSRVVVAALVPAKKNDENRFLIEALKKSAEQAGGVIVGTLIQRRGFPVPESLAVSPA